LITYQQLLFALAAVAGLNLILPTEVLHQSGLIEKMQTLPPGVDE